MGSRLEILVHGTGNAWPVPLGETHPFYDRTNPRDLSNASFSVRLKRGNHVESELLVDAGHGTIQSLIMGANRIPEAILLTHGHMDHTLSVDWVVQSHWRTSGKRGGFPLYASAGTYRFLIHSYPHLEKLINHTPLIPGRSLFFDREGTCRLTGYPVYHGSGAPGASMLCIEWHGRRILFTGDLLTPLLRKEDYIRLDSPDLVVADTNNRFPWPRTNHWSFSGGTRDPLSRDNTLRKFIRNLGWDDVSRPHLVSDGREKEEDYFRILEREWNVPDQPFTLVEFLRLIQPKKTMVVHYSGLEDARHHSEQVLDRDQLGAWCNGILEQCGTGTEIMVPSAGLEMEI